MLLGAYPKIYPVAKAPIPDPSEAPPRQSGVVANATDLPEAAAKEAIQPAPESKGATATLDAVKTRTIEMTEIGEVEKRQSAIADQTRSEVMFDTLVFRANLADEPASIAATDDVAGDSLVRATDDG